MEDGKVYCEVKRRGFEDTENDWQSLDLLKEDVPEFLSEFISDIKTSGTKRQRNLAKTLE